jgi:hypothetical protein
MKSLLANWKTTLAGVIALVIQIGPVLWPTVITPAVANTISVISASIGVVVAKDGNVTGGTTTQPSK